MLLSPATATSRAAEGRSAAAAALGGRASDGQAGPSLPAIRGVFGSPSTFATHAQFATFGFAWGPPDGALGAIPASNGTYTFFAAAGSACSVPSGSEGAFSFIGTLDHLTGGDGCRKLFGPGDGPPGWVFDKDYAGGGQVVRFAAGGKSGWLMPVHGEIHWPNPSTSDHLCAGAACFYFSLGLAVSTDNGKTWRLVGQILQPSEPLSTFEGTGTDMPGGYGSLIVADANGQHLDNPPSDPTNAYFYLFYSDIWPAASSGVCAQFACLGVARAPYIDVVNATLSGNPDQVATVFHKYDGGSPDPWTQPATSDTPDESGTAGAYAPLWTDEVAYQAEVLYDAAFNAYLAIYESGTFGQKFSVRASSDLIHWSPPIGASYSEPGRVLYQPSLIGETGDPTIGGPAPRVFVSSSFPAGAWPNWNNSVLETLPLTLSSTP